jgi:hypothetical protein
VKAAVGAVHRTALYLSIMEANMRLPLFSPSELSAEQRLLYDDMRKGIENEL